MNVNKESLSKPLSGSQLGNIPKVSVIVPVYNVEKYLRSCVESILAQTFTDFELLLVDDGSPDGSGAICDEYAGKDDRVRVFHKENGGVTSARYLGAQKAKGAWLSFVDPDDALPENSLELLTNTLKKTDAKIIKGAYRVTGVDGMDWERNFIEGEHSFKDFFIKNRALSLWAALFDKKLFLSLNQPPSELIIGEDLNLVLQAVSITNLIYFVPHICYYYQTREGGATNAGQLSCFVNNTVFFIFIGQLDQNIINNRNVMLINKELVKMYLIQILRSSDNNSIDANRFKRKYLQKYLWFNPIQWYLLLNRYWNSFLIKIKIKKK